ncbi:hypothetical protein GCL60_05510 [Silvanigrella paludirubra]|jgi:hypothetical protein|uniref:Uncharacterized protein n=1 Tax=Silvanigrella paludirubra TaxID=2499159 RepID=A0A6N6VVD0_9BACT|nr:hypothetical protein [Silvanigrella paludirubra]KAB8039719.1 hypothetical protein GCL60_05510 [Silvanigrella paludirubra]
MGSKSDLSTLWMTEVNPTQFFHEMVVEAQERQRLKLTENVEFYIVNLLCGYLRASDSDSNEDCLALILKKALESSHSEKIALYKKLADTALYFSGFFQEYFNRKSFDIRYYVTMGESAYNELSNLLKGKNTYQETMSTIYYEMSKNFTVAVDILLDISEQTTNQNNERTILSLYDAWLNTASPKLEKELFHRGVNPIKVSTRKV